MTRSFGGNSANDAGGKIIKVDGQVFIHEVNVVAFTIQQLLSCFEYLVRQGQIEQIRAR